MKLLKYLILLSLTFLVLCKPKYSERSFYKAPNWTRDNKVVFAEEKEYYRDIHRPLIGVERRYYKKEIYIWEVDLSQSYRRVAKVYEGGYDDAPWVVNLSSALDWIAIGYDGEIWLIKRDGTNLHKLTDGKYPDFSPDAQKIVFVRDDGIYIINRDGSNLRRIVVDSGANYPSWSTDNSRIAFVKGSATYPEEGNLVIVDTAGNFLEAHKTRIIAPDWGPPDSNAIAFNNWDYGCILYLNTRLIDTIYAQSRWEGLFLWALRGDLFIKNMTVVKRDGSKIFTIKP